MIKKYSDFISESLNQNHLNVNLVYLSIKNYIEKKIKKKVKITLKGII